MKRIKISAPVFVLSVIIGVLIVLISSLRLYLTYYNCRATWYAGKMPKLMTDLRENLEARFPGFDDANNLDVPMETRQRFISARTRMTVVEKQFIIRAGDGLLRDGLWGILSQFQHGYHEMSSLITDDKGRRAYDIKCNREINNFSLEIGGPYRARRYLVEELPILCHYFRWMYPRSFVYSRYLNEVMEQH